MKRSKLKLLAVALVIVAFAAVAAEAASSPSVSTGSVSNITSSSAELHGTVNPNGSSATYYFQWGLTPSFGITGHFHSAGSGTKTVSVTATPTGLISGTKYYYRIVASNKYGSSSGQTRTFTTGGHPPPNLATGPATNITKSSATVTGTVNPNGAATTYTFEYGITTSYGFETFAQTLPAGTNPQAVSVTLTGLEPGTTFYYRLVGENGATVVAYGSQEQFMTYPSPRPIPRVTARTTPRTARTAPYTFTTTGKVAGPSSIPNSLACTGNATLRFFLGRRQVSFSLVPLNPDCTFSASTTFNHRVRHATALRVFFHFRGNGYLAPSDARPQRVVLG